MVAFARWCWPRRTSMDEHRAVRARGMDPRFAGVMAPKSAWTQLALLAAVGAVGCGSKADNKTYDPVALGMVSTDMPFYDDGDTQLFEVKRPISLPVMPPTDAQRASLNAPV